MTHITTIIYHVWEARNLLIFKGMDIPATEVCCKAQTAISNYNLVNRLHHTFKDHQSSGMNCRNTGWTPPAKGDLKLNVDAHCLGDGRWCLGFILCREDGDPIVVATREIMSMEDATVQRLMEFLKRLSL